MHILRSNPMNREKPAAMVATHTAASYAPPPPPNLGRPKQVATRADCDLDRRPILYGRAAWSGQRVIFELMDPEHATRLPAASSS